MPTPSDHTDAVPNTTPNAIATRRGPPIVLRSVEVNDGDAPTPQHFEVTFTRTPVGDYVAVQLTGRAIADTEILVGREGASVTLHDPRALYALHRVLGVLITEAEAAGLLSPAWAATTEEA